MTLDQLFMPLPAGHVRGYRVTPLGTWGVPAPDEALERRRAAWRKYAANNPDKRRESVRAWRARRKAA